jgi:hypothetical protein
MGDLLCNVKMWHCKQVPVDVRLPAVGREAVEGPELIDASGSSSEDEDATDMADAQVPSAEALKHRMIQTQCVMRC